MRTKYYAYDRWVSLFIDTCETLITGGLFYLLFLTTEDTPWHKILQAPHLQVILTVMLCYFVSAMQAGVVLYRRKVYAYQILSKVLKSTICFGVLSGVVLELGRFMDAWSYFYLTFLGLLFISLSVFRILMRWGLKRYRSKGGNLRYVVLVGSSENNRELYYELTTQDWTGFRVKGYFDFEPNPKFPQECPYLGKPQDVKEYLEKNGNTHYLFCCLPSKEHVIIRSLINYCENHLVHFYSVPNIYNYLQNRVYFTVVHKGKAHQGEAAGPGLTYGYAWPLSKRFNLEFSAGVGALWYREKKYPEGTYLKKEEYNANGVKCVPTEVAVSCCYLF